MLKKFSLYLTLFLSLFLFNNLNSYAATMASLKCGSLIEGADKTSKTCELIFEVTERKVKYNNIEISFTLENMSLSDNDIVVNDNWKIEKKSDLVYSFSTYLSSLDIGTYKIATFTFYKIAKQEQCQILYSLKYNSINRACMEYEGHYYNKAGEIVEENIYEEDCFKHICEEINGNFYGSSGTKVSEQTYHDQCDEEENHFCEVISNEPETEYYDSTGASVSKEEYEKDCFTHICENIYDTYYDLEGNETTKAKYEEDCFKHYCEKVNDDYFNSEGNKVSEEEYEEDCIIKYYCEEVDNVYYNSTGNIVSKEDYTKDCLKPTCEELDGTYYDTQGNIVSKTDYTIDCLKPVCEKIEDTYYGKDGTVVTEENFKKYCKNDVDNPQTGNLSTISAIILFISGSAIILYLNSKNKLIDKI